MTDAQPNLHDDIAYMRELAAAGAKTPIVGGGWLVAAGSVFGGANIVGWFLDRAHLMSGKTVLALNVGAMALFILVGVLLTLRAKNKPGYNSVANQAFGVVWSSVGFSFFILGMAAWILTWRLDSGLPLTFFPSAGLVMYAIGWSVSAAMSRQRWLWIPALGSQAAALIAALLMSTPYFALFFAFAMFALALLPGLKLMRAEPSLTV